MIGNFFKELFAPHQGVKLRNIELSCLNGKELAFKMEIKRGKKWEETEGTIYKNIPDETTVEGVTPEELAEFYEHVGFMDVVRIIEQIERVKWAELELTVPQNILFKMGIGLYVGPLKQEDIRSQLIKKKRQRDIFVRDLGYMIKDKNKELSGKLQTDWG